MVDLVPVFLNALGRSFICNVCLVLPLQQKWRHIKELCEDGECKTIQPQTYIELSSIVPTGTRTGWHGLLPACHAKKPMLNAKKCFMITELHFMEKNFKI